MNLKLLLGIFVFCTVAQARQTPVPGSSPAEICLLDLRPLNTLDLSRATNASTLWDTLHTAAALQGLINRHEPRLYLLYCSDFGVETDQFWLDWLRNEEGWLKKSNVRRLDSLQEAIRLFRTSFKGLVIYDGDVPATSNLASTAAGCDDLLPVRYDRAPDSMFDRLVQQMKIPVALWLIHRDGAPKFTGRGLIPDSTEPSSGSAKIDVYRWGASRYLTHCAPGLAAYYVDAFWLKCPRQADPTMHTLSNHDYFIAKRAFFFDLSPWADEPPSDDPRQALGLDRTELLDLMRRLYFHNNGGIIKVGGFTPWPFKYTTHSRPPGKHEGVPTEWEYARLISQFNGYMEADAAGLGAMANASFYQHYPLADHYSQRGATAAAKRSRAQLLPNGSVPHKFYLAHYVGDYDAPSWLYKAVPKFFNDPARGKVPLGWAFDPNLSDRAPQALVYAYRQATSNDFFIAGDSGAGYLNPRALTVRPDSRLPSGLEAWSNHCRPYFARWDLSITGFILDGSAGASTETEFAAYRPFSANGAGTHFEPGPAIRAGVPTCREQDLPDDVKAAARMVAHAATQKRSGAGFMWARTILRSPSWYAELSQILARDHSDLKIEVVDPYTFFDLIRREFR